MTSLAIAFLLLFVCLTWHGPRYFGLIGLVVAHVSILVGYFVLAGLSIANGTYEYDGVLSHFGLLLQAFLINCLLMPVGIAGLWRRHRSLAKVRTDKYPSML